MCVCPLMRRGVGALQLLLCGYISPFVPLHVCTSCFVPERFPELSSGLAMCVHVGA